MREEWRLAGFVDRFGADVLDSLFGGLVALSVYLLVDRPFLMAEGSVLGGPGVFAAGDAALLLWFLWNLTYSVGKTGQSWGRRLAGVKVVGSDGDPIGFWRALGRNLFAGFISAPIFYLGFLWILWDTDKQAWHDKVFRTYVLRWVVL